MRRWKSYKRILFDNIYNKYNFDVFIANTIDKQDAFFQNN